MAIGDCTAPLGRFEQRHVDELERVAALRADLPMVEQLERQEIAEAVQNELVGLFLALQLLIARWDVEDWGERLVVQTLLRRGQDLAGTCFMATNPDAIGIESLRKHVGEVARTEA